MDFVSFSITNVPFLSLKLYLFLHQPHNYLMFWSTFDEKTFLAKIVKMLIKWTKYRNKKITVCVLTDRIKFRNFNFVLPSNAPHVAAMRLYNINFFRFFTSFSQIIRQIKMKIILLKINALKAEIRCRLAGSVFIIKPCKYKDGQTSQELIFTSLHHHVELNAFFNSRTLLLIQNILIAHQLAFPNDNFTVDVSLYFNTEKSSP